MQAVVLTGHGGLERLEYHTDWPTPVAGPNEVLIRVGACGLNNTDVNTRLGWYSKSVSGATGGGGSTDQSDGAWGGRPMTFPRIQGADAVGIVAACGPGVDAALTGRRVMVDGWLRDWNDPLNRESTGYFGSECDGGFAEYTTADVRNVAAVESPLSDAELATFSCSSTTAENMLNRAGVAAGDRVLITGASGGVGSALIQLCRRRGATAIALAAPEKHDAVRACGADAVLPRAGDDLRGLLKKAAGFDSVSVVADVVGGDEFPKWIDALERGGRYTCSGAIAGPLVHLDLRTFYLRDLTFTGCTVTAPHVFSDLVGYIERGEIRPMLAASWPLKDLRTAQQAFMDKKHTGNIAVIP